MSKYCCPTCSKRAYKKRANRKRERGNTSSISQANTIQQGYLTVKESMLIYGISKDVLYRMIRKGLIPSYNFWSASDTPLVGSIWMNTSKQRLAVEREKRKHCPFEPKGLLHYRRDCQKVPYQ